MTYPKFTNDIVRMNGIYELAPLEHANVTAVHARLLQFKDILDKEFGELTDIQVAADHALIQQPEGLHEESLKRIRIDMADLLGDIIVYCASEAERWQIPLQDVLKIIMASNFSKLGEDGKPIKDANDKFQKGPNYWKPEPLIGELLAGKLQPPVDFLAELPKIDMDAVTAAATGEQK